MPTLIREEGFEIRIYTFDHPPPHVHVAKAGAIMKIDLSTHEVTEIVGTISDRDVKRAERLVARHVRFLRGEWSRPFFLIVYTGGALAILKNTTDGTTLFGRPALQDFEGL